MIALQFRYLGRWMLRHRTDNPNLSVKAVENEWGGLQGSQSVGTWTAGSADKGLSKMVYSSSFVSYCQCYWYSMGRRSYCSQVPGQMFVMYSLKIQPWLGSTIGVQQQQKSNQRGVRCPGQMCSSVAIFPKGGVGTFTLGLSICW